MRLTGFVRCASADVVVEVQGETRSARDYPMALRAVMPSGVRLDAVTSLRIPPAHSESRFLIEEDGQEPAGGSLLTPDLAPCPECVRELFTPGNRRYLYPFIGCTHCGPRSSIGQRSPFQRNATAMAAFPPCPECLAEYQDPSNRRFHEETVSCPACGPSLRLRDREGRLVEGDPLPAAIQALACGKTVSVEGVDGVRILADPSVPGAAGRVPDFLVRDIETARALCILTADDEEALLSRPRPLLILPSRGRDAALPGIVGDAPYVGILLPPTPVYILLFGHPGAGIPCRCLTMVEGAGRDLDFRLEGTLRGVSRTEDSVFRSPSGLAGGWVPVRRSRGFIPSPVRLGRGVAEPTVAAGADRTGSPAVAVRDRLDLSPPCGDLRNGEAQAAYCRWLEGRVASIDGKPARVVCDLDSSLFSSRWAAGQAFRSAVRVQHHHAHALSVMAEYGLQRSLGIVFDGPGLGTDGGSWGGEFLHATREGFRRLGSIEPFPTFSGPCSAVRRLTAHAILKRAAGEAEAGRLCRLSADGGDDPVSTTSMGTLFQAVEALWDPQGTSGDEECVWTGLERTAYAEIRRGGASAGEPLLKELVPMRTGAEGRFSLDFSPLVLLTARAASSGSGPRDGLLFHQAAASACLRAALAMREMTGLCAVCLGGSLFQNVVLRHLTVTRLCEAGFKPYLNRSVPAGDGGIAAGQAYYAGGDGVS